LKVEGDDIRLDSRMIKDERVRGKEEELEERGLSKLG
jgi:hypothetical protein